MKKTQYYRDPSLTYKSCVPHIIDNNDNIISSDWDVTKCKILVYIHRFSYLLYVKAVCKHMLQAAFVILLITFFVGVRF